MGIKRRVFTGFLIIGCFIGFVGIIAMIQLENTLFSLNLLDDKIDELNESEDLLSHSMNIRYYDEVLIQSARNYAFTGDEKWRQRYLETEPILSDELSRSLGIGNIIEKDFFRQVDEVNNNLVELELESIELVQTGNKEKAVIILEYQEYLENKNIYKSGLEKYLTSRDLRHTSLMRESTIDVENP